MVSADCKLWVDRFQALCWSKSRFIHPEFPMQLLTQVSIKCHEIFLSTCSNSVLLRCCLLQVLTSGTKNYPTIRITGLSNSRNGEQCTVSPPISHSTHLCMVILATGWPCRYRSANAQRIETNSAFTFLCAQHCTSSPPIMHGKLSYTGVLFNCVPCHSRRASFVGKILQGPVGRNVNPGIG